MGFTSGSENRSDFDQNVYTYSEFNSQARREVSTGTVSGDTWTWTNTQNYGGEDVNAENQYALACWREGKDEAQLGSVSQGPKGSCETCPNPRPGPQ